VWNGSKWEELGNEGSYKITQEAVSGPTGTTGKTSNFVDNITQDTNGNISYTTKAVEIDIKALGDGDDIITVEPTGGKNSVEYDVTHKKHTAFTKGDSTSPVYDTSKTFV
jgi:alpha-L-fucosidase